MFVIDELVPQDQSDLAENEGEDEGSRPPRPLSPSRTTSITEEEALGMHSSWCVSTPLSLFPSLSYPLPSPFTTVLDSLNHHPNPLVLCSSLSSQFHAQNCNISTIYTGVSTEVHPPTDELLDQHFEVLDIIGKVEVERDRDTRRRDKSKSSTGEGERARWTGTVSKNYKLLVRVFVLPGNSKKEGGGSKREGSSREKGRDRERDREKESSRRNVDGDNREQERSSKDSKQSNWGIYFSLTSYYSLSLSPSLSLSLSHSLLLSRRREKGNISYTL